MYLENILAQPDRVQKLEEIPNSNKVNITLKNGLKINALKEQFKNYEKFKADCLRS